ncbi:MAG: glutamate-1-semialdehyde 2,1-aminomutase [Phycisphaera sp.]|nr:glutamate-1-semialdehyde 2,1-aminomutase [Phycisphaera sp.]
MNTPADDTRYAQSHASHAKAQQLMPGGVNSPVRAYSAVGGSPIVIRSGAGCRVTDVDGNEYVDYVCSYGPLIAGHAHPAVVAAVTRAASRGASFGMPTEAESQLAEAVIKAVPSVDVVRFVNSGTEATMSAIRLARGATGRDKIVKCVGGYHGHADALLVQAGSGATTLGVPSSPGVPKGATADTLLMPYNDLDAAAALFGEHDGAIAAIIIEPVAGNMGCVPPSDGYLAGLRKLCDDHGTLLIFDEVMTGFRVAFGGAQAKFDVTPDITCLGKVLGGGLPCAAYGASAEIMNRMAPVGPIYQAGTLSGNPVAMAAGLATLEVLREPGSYKRLDDLTQRLADGLIEAAEASGVSIQINRVGSMITPFFTDKPVTDYAGATACDTAAFGRFFRTMLDQGVTLPPSQFEAWFVSLAHDEEAIDETLAAATRAFASV